MSQHIEFFFDYEGAHRTAVRETQRTVRKGRARLGTAARTGMVEGKGGQDEHLSAEATGPTRSPLLCGS